MLLVSQLRSVKLAETVWSDTLLNAKDAVWLKGEKYCRWLDVFDALRIYD